MMTSIQGVYREGRIELAEPPANVSEGTPVIVTFLSNGAADLAAHGISPAQAAELRARLASFAEDWESPEMNAYDNYRPPPAPTVLETFPKGAGVGTLE